MSSLERSVLELLALPRGEQPAAVEALLRQAGEAPPDEAWNTRFGPDSLFDAWTRTSVVQGVHAANADVIRPLLDARPDWRVVEVGVGDGRLWQRVLGGEDRGELVLVDPVGEAHQVVRARLPPGVRVTSELRRLEDATVPEADVVVCSLTLHHVAGRDAAERAAHGLSGPGKVELLRRLGEAVAPRGGLVLLNEADVHCEIDLLPGDPVLRDRLLDSYVRRCGLSIVHDLQRADRPEGADRSVADRWRAILRRWCLEQVAAWSVPVADRDVYELDVGRWREVARRAGLEVQRVRCTDRYGLFYQYLLRV